MEYWETTGIQTKEGIEITKNCLYKMIQIGGLQKLSLIDYSGKLACSVFLIGCNFRCGFCHNPELILLKQIKQQLPLIKSAKGGTKQFNGAGISEKYFFDFLKERKNLLEGVCLSGGEPTINQDLPQFCQKIKKLGYLIKLDTNGSNPEMLNKLIDQKLIDYIAMDIKAPIGAKNQKSNVKTQNYKSKLKTKKNKYEKITNKKIDIEKIKKSIAILKKGEVSYEFRSTILPQVHSKEDVINMAKWIKNAKTYYLQQFRPEKTLDPKYEKYKPFSQKQIEAIQKKCNKYVFTKLRL